MLVNNQLVCLPPVGIFKPTMFIWTKLSFSLSSRPGNKLVVAKCTDHYKHSAFHIVSSLLCGTRKQKKIQVSWQFPCKRSVWENHDQERTNQNAGIYLNTTLPYNKVDICAWTLSVAQSEQIMSTEKYPSIFLCQMKAIVYAHHSRASHHRKY